jgi:hypothetical protein
MKMIIKRIKLLILFILLVFAYQGYAQSNWWKDKKIKNADEKTKYELCKKTFIDIGYGFSYNNIDNISKYLTDQVYLNLIGSDNGYYSKYQSEQIIMDFMNYFAVEKFYYRTSNYKSNYAFAIGKYKYNRGSGSTEIELTVSLTYSGSQWYIDQITAN